MTSSIPTFGKEGCSTVGDNQESGDLGCEPLGLIPENPERLLVMQNRKLGNWRLAIITITGMIAQGLFVRADGSRTDGTSTFAQQRNLGLRTVFKGCDPFIWAPSLTQLRRAGNVANTDKFAELLTHPEQLYKAVNNHLALGDSQDMLGQILRVNPEENAQMRPLKDIVCDRADTTLTPVCPPNGIAAYCGKNLTEADAKADTTCRGQGGVGQCDTRMLATAPNAPDLLAASTNVEGGTTTQLANETASVTYGESAKYTACVCQAVEVARTQPPVRPETAHAMAAAAEARKMRQGTATGPPRMPVDLANPGLSAGSSLVSLPPLPRDAAEYDNYGPMQHVFVKTTTGHTMTVRIHSWHDPISTIEAHMRRRQSTPTGMYRLVFAGKALTHSHWTLAQYGIGEGSTLEVLGRLRGGMPAKREASGQTNGDDNMDTTEAPQQPQAANSSLQVWAKWVQGPYQALLRSAHFAQQLDEWELAFLEALTEQEIPEGAVAAMTTRAGMALNAAEATRAMAAYKGRRSLQPDFVHGVFRRVPGRDSDTNIAEAPPQLATAATTSYRTRVGHMGRGTVRSHREPQHVRQRPRQVGGGHGGVLDGS